MLSGIFGNLTTEISTIFNGNGSTQRVAVTIRVGTGGI